MTRTSLVTLLVAGILVFCCISCSAKDLTRSKRQLQVYYMCNGGVSQYPCNNNNNCGYNNCNYGGNSMILPTSFYNSNSNCNSGCGNLNCNQYTGQFINGQYVAYSMGSNAYSPCASSCCSSNNNNNNNIYNPYNNNNNYQNILPSVGNSVSNMPYASRSFTGTYSNGMYLCGASEPSGGVCNNNGICPSGHSCVAGNVCCRCPVGASAGNCQSNNDCSAGYSCAGTGFCCPSQITTDTQLETCINGMCPDGSACGVGNLCYPNGFFN